MIGNINLLHHKFSFEVLQEAADKLEVELAQKRGARIGEASVISRYVHMVDPQKPEIVQILTASDAGQTFYQRKDLGSILHIDVFHACGIIDPRLVAEAIKGFIDTFNSEYKDADCFFCSDGIDIQTAGGGGRITGSLQYGKKSSVCKTHQNHVHIAMRTPSSFIVIFYVIYAVEKAIMASRLELRCNEKILYIRNRGNAKIDVSPYQYASDSILRDDREAALFFNKTVETEIGTQEQPRNTMIKIPYAEKLQTQIDTSNEAVQSNNLGESSDSQVLVGISKNVMIRTIINLLSTKHKGVDRAYFENKNITKMEERIRYFQKRNLRQAKVGKLSEILRMQLSGDPSKRRTEKVGLASYTELNLSETIQAAACRTVSEKQDILRITQDDLRQYVRRSRSQNDLCLVIDASLSMDGKRIIAAKEFARKLLSRVTGRVSIITFQDNEAQIKVPLTKNYALLEKGISSINASGRTPLALGLQAGVQYLVKSKANKAILILITDGLPDSSNTTLQKSLDDAMSIARSIRKYGFHFIGVGLKPHQEYLAKLSQAAGGEIYILDEISNQYL